MAQQRRRQIGARLKRVKGAREKRRCTQVCRDAAAAAAAAAAADCDDVAAAAHTLLTIADSDAAADCAPIPLQTPSQALTRPTHHTNPCDMPQRHRT